MEETMTHVPSQRIDAGEGRVADNSVNPRAQALATRLMENAEALAAFASGLTDGEWQTRLARDGRKIGVVIHHVASVYPVEIRLARLVADGEPVTGLGSGDIDAMNASHAFDHDEVARDATVALLRRNAAEAATAIRQLRDEELDRAVPVSLYGDATLTCQFVLEDHAVRHSRHHLARIRAALAR
jgi:hypothetical protein